MCLRRGRRFEQGPDCELSRASYVTWVVVEEAHACGVGQRGRVGEEARRWGEGNADASSRARHVVEKG